MTRQTKRYRLDYSGKKSILETNFPEISDSAVHTALQKIARKQSLEFLIGENTDGTCYFHIRGRHAPNKRNVTYEPCKLGGIDFVNFGQLSQFLYLYTYMETNYREAHGL